MKNRLSKLLCWMFGHKWEWGGSIMISGDMRLYQAVCARCDKCIYTETRYDEIYDE